MRLGGHCNDLDPNLTRFSVPGSFTSTLDTNKYKFLTKILLDDLEIVKCELKSISLYFASCQSTNPNRFCYQTYYSIDYSSSTINFPPACLVTRAIHMTFSGLIR